MKVQQYMLDIQIPLFSYLTKMSYAWPKTTIYIHIVSGWTPMSNLKLKEPTCFERTVMMITINIQFADVVIIHMSACAGEYTQNRMNKKSFGVQIVPFRTEKQWAL